MNSEKKYGILIKTMLGLIFGLTIGLVYIPVFGKSYALLIGFIHGLGVGAGFAFFTEWLKKHY